MKNLKKILALVLVAMMVLSLSVTAFASDDPPAADDPIVGTYGSITVKNATKGQDYKAYKVFDATYSGTAVSYKTAATNASKLDSNIFGWSTAADADGNISVWVKDGVAEADVIDWVKANYDKFGGTAINGVFDDANSTVTFQALPYGYYYITSTLGTAVTIDSAVPTATVYDKNETTPVDPVKKIVSVDGEAQDEVTEANAHVGSVVGFKVTAKTNNWIDKDTIRAQWTLTDTATNMTIDPESIVVTVNGEEIQNFTASGTGDGGMTLNIPMVDDKGNSVYPATQANNGLIPIEITYSATITKDAGDSPAKNEIPGSEVKVYTYAFQLAKTNDKNEPLEGAQFELWANNAALKFIDNDDGTYTYSPEGTVTTLDMTTNTTIVVKGLDNKWSYTIKEITVPEGYNKVDDIALAGSSLTKVTDGMDTSMNTTALYKQTVVNKAGVELPSTGGIGTTLFYVIGSILVLGAGVVLVAKKRAID